jgi:hypothetical protein
MKQNKVVRKMRWLIPGFALAALGAWFSLASGHAFGATEPGACTTNSDCRELDFWLGDWTVLYPGASFPSSSKVSLELNKCLLVESWDGGKGHRGKNMFAYSSDDKKWHGMFADNQGRVHVFEGKVASGSAEFVGPSMSRDGKTVLNRIRVVRIDADKVQQTWEKSPDKGATWNMEFRGDYTRKKP